MTTNDILHKDYTGFCKNNKKLSAQDIKIRKYKHHGKISFPIAQ